jgi:hypothetical protein
MTLLPTEEDMDMKAGIIINTIMKKVRADLKCYPHYPIDSSGIGKTSPKYFRILMKIE